mmetsp:Transcript_75377/g.209444  ORF Transcript_75377/g.209444 Transcript_75377/m.209444 type:complete len:266 (-) Transcript_75377:144-941(-)
MYKIGRASAARFAPPRCRKRKSKRTTEPTRAGKASLGVTSLAPSPSSSPTQKRSSPISTCEPARNDVGPLAVEAFASGTTATTPTRGSVSDLTCGTGASLCHTWSLLPGSLRMPLKVSSSALSPTNNFTRLRRSGSWVSRSSVNGGFNGSFTSRRMLPREAASVLVASPWRWCSAADAVATSARRRAGKMPSTATTPQTRRSARAVRSCDVVHIPLASSLSVGVRLAALAFAQSSRTSSTCRSRSRGPSRTRARAEARKALPSNS